MKITTFLTTVLFGAAFAQDQVPLKEKAAAWLDIAKSYIPSSVPSIPNPVEAAAGVFADKTVQKINIRNYQRILKPKLEGEEEWIIYATGGNKSCFGRCARADAAWNEAVPLLSALPQPAGAPTLHLGTIDCEKEQVFCNSMVISAPSVLYFNFPILPYPNASPQPASEFRYTEFNRTTVVAEDMVLLASAAPGTRIYQFPVYDGILHPVDGWLARLGIQEYLGYVIWGMGTTPSWIIMIVISFASRQFMSRKMINKPDVYGRRPGQTPGQGVPPPPPPPAAGAGRGTPGGAAKGGKKKR